MLGVYWPSLRTPFVLDDIRGIQDNPSLQAGATAGQVLFPGPETFSNGRPLLNLSFWLDQRWSGGRLAAYHADNLLIHFLAACLVWALLCRGGAGPWSFVGALLWAVHPIQTEAVTYLSQRAESLMGFWYLLTLVAAARRWNIAAVLACLAGMLTKETMVTAPFAVVLFDRCFQFGSFAEAWKARRGLYLALAATWIPLGILMAVSGLSQRGVGLHGAVSALGYLHAECHAVARYLTLGIWPHPLIFDYGPNYPAGASAGATVFCAGFVLAAIAAAVWLCRRRPRMGCWAVWFFLLLLPTSSVVPISGSPIAESRLYLPLVAAVGFAVAVLRQCRFAPFALLAAIPAAGAAAAVRNATYLDPVTLWRDTLRKAPANYRAKTQLATLISRRPGQAPEAEALYMSALGQAPHYPEANDGMGVLLEDAGKPGEARRYFETAVRAYPNGANYHYHLGRVLQALGDRSRAQAQFLAALALEPRFPDVHDALGIWLAAIPGQLDAAIAQYREALVERPDYPEAENNLGLARSRQPQGLGDAIRHYRTAIAEDPKMAAAHYNLGNALLISGDQPNAVTEYRAAIRLNPRYAEAHNNLAAALASRPGGRAEALAEVNEALRINPGLRQAQALKRILERR